MRKCCADKCAFFATGNLGNKSNVTAGVIRAPRGASGTLLELMLCSVDRCLDVCLVLMFGLLNVVFINVVCIVDALDCVTHYGADVFAITTLLMKKKNLISV